MQSKKPGHGQMRVDLRSEDCCYQQEAAQQIAQAERLPLRLLTLVLPAKFSYNVSRFAGPASA